MLLRKRMADMKEQATIYNRGCHKRTIKDWKQTKADVVNGLFNLQSIRLYIFACDISNYSVSVFHLMNRMFFKALLFLSVGLVVHAMLDEQDMQNTRGLPPQTKEGTPY